MVAPRPHSLHAAHLALFGVWPDPQGRHVAALALLVRVHPDDDPFRRLQLAFELERGIGDLALEEPVLDAPKDTALLVNLIEVALRAALHLIGKLLDEVRADQSAD